MITLDDNTNETPRVYLETTAPVTSRSSVAYRIVELINALATTDVLNVSILSEHGTSGERQRPERILLSDWEQDLEEGIIDRLDLMRNTPII